MTRLRYLLCHPNHGSLLVHKVCSLEQLLHPSSFVIYRISPSRAP